ncbi:MAG TPA: glycosyltransferase family A protein [Albitalea sp.]|uniref:glycosyltransferase family 2 protein n=1 Tax=Piscinibacter sp. TaxID=1903157 RepID=UPI002ED2ACCA
MNSPAPLVTVGIPVYNGERYLARAIESLLTQTLADFELIVADNASTDRTQQMCEDYARRDSRVRYVRHPSNIGAPRNWNCLVDLARGKYFKWATANDRNAPTMLARCVEVLESDPGVVLCYGHTLLMDEDERPIEVFNGDIDVPMAAPSERFAAVCTRLTLNNAMCGVIRTGVLKRTGMDRLYPSGDMALMSELALYGRFRLLSDVLLQRRQAPGTFTSMLSPIQIQRVYNPGARFPMKMLRGRRHWDNFSCIVRAPIAVREKLRALGTAARLLAWDRGVLFQELRSLLGPSRNAS